MLNTGKIGILGLAAMSVAMTGCSSVDDDAEVVSDRDYEYVADFMEMIGGKVDKNQTWVTGTAISATVKTSGEAVVSVYTLGKETRTLYARKKVDGNGVLVFDIPQNSDEMIAFEAEYGDGERVYRKMNLSTALNQFMAVDMSRNATRAMAESNSVKNPNSALICQSNSSTEGGYAGHNFGYTSFPGWVWDDLAKAVPESVDPKKNNMITNYELISTGPFYLSLLYGCTGTYSSAILGYYFYKEKGVYSDIVMVDLMDVLNYDYVDGYAKVQYQLAGESAGTWHDANFDYRDGDGLVKNKFTTSQVKRQGDNAYNTLLVNQEYDGVDGIQAVRGMTFQINVPVGYRLGFYLKRAGSMSDAQKKQLTKIGVPQKYIDVNRPFCFSGSALNIGNKPWKSVIRKYDGYTFMGLDDNADGGDNDCNDVTFGLTAGNGGSLPGVLLPGVQDLDTDKYYNNDGTVTESPKEVYVQNVVEGRDPFDYGTPSTPGEGEESADVPVYDLPAWTIAYEDKGVKGDFDFNDFVIKVVPNTANKAKVYACANGGTLDAELHYDGPEGDVKLGRMHQYLPARSNVGDKIDYAPVLVGEVEWPEGYLMTKDAYRFYIVLEGKKIAVSQTSGSVPQAICVAGEWRWPKEHVNLSTAYSLVGEWAKNIFTSEGRDWYMHPAKGCVVSFE